MTRKRSNSRAAFVCPTSSINNSEYTTFIVTPQVNSGQPIGSTKKKLGNHEMSIVAAKNEIATLYAEEKKQS